MMEYICGPIASLTRAGFPDNQSIVLLGKATRLFPQSIGSNIARDLLRISGNPNSLIWDTLATFLAISAVDLAADRSFSPDGWTRQLNVTIAVHNDVKFNAASTILSSAASFLTGDIWHISFINCPEYTPSRSRRHPCANSDCVALLSGGLDSLIGHIDLVGSGKNPMAVSHVYRGDKNAQQSFRRRINPAGVHFLTSQSEHLLNKPSPPSQRARSLTFLGLAIAGAGSLARYASATESTCIYLPENGFISLNPPMSIARIGSHSTRTTHPTFLRMLQEFISRIGVNVQFVNPYQLKTKGEMISDCSVPELFRELAPQSISCGKYRVNNLAHCGSCIPCLVRRAAFNASGFADQTKYTLRRFSLRGKLSKLPSDIRDVALGLSVTDAAKMRRMVIPYLSGIESGMHSDLCNTAQRGADELANLLGVQRAR